MKRRGQRRRGESRRTNRAINRITEWFTFSISNGSEQGVTVATLSVPRGFNYRPIMFEVEAMYYTPQAAPVTSGYLPSSITVGGVQLQLYDSNGERCATSRPVVTGTNPRRITVRYPPSAGFWGATVATTTNIAVINSVCLGAQSVSYLRGVGRFTYSMTQEELIASCPSLVNHETEGEGEGAERGSSSPFTQV